MPDTQDGRDPDGESRVSINNARPGYDPAKSRDGVTTRVLSAYSVGHFANDLCASMWFIYLSYYLLYVADLPENIASLALLSGQIADGITTPIVGTMSDRISCSCGAKNAWYYFGSLLVIPCFLCIFLNFDLNDETMKNAWYISFPAIFNVGWASVQIAHMSIVNSLAYSQRKRDTMVNNRNAFTYGANILMLTTSLILFLFISNSTLQFRVLSLFCVGVGVITSLFYVGTVIEPPLTKKATEGEENYQLGLGKKPKPKVQVTDTDGKVKIQGKRARDWLSEAQFYIFGVVYMSARIALNATATMMPLYLRTVCLFTPRPGMETSAQIASVPLVSYIFSLIFSLTLQARITQKFANRLVPMAMAFVVTTIASVPLGFLDGSDIRYLVYPCAAL